MHPDIPALIAHYGLTPLPSEGTLFASTYRSVENVAGGGPAGTAIIALYCTAMQSHSLFHRLPVDEIWHFYRGAPLRLVLLHPDGSARDVILGNDPLRGEQVQCVIPAGTWQAGHCIDGGAYSLFGCTMAPGFTGAMYEGGAKEVLMTSHPDRREDIERFGCTPEETRMPEGFAG